MEEAKTIRKEKAQIQDLAFKIFAFVGFLSSIVTIISWLSSTQSSLSAIVSPTTLEMPAELQLSNKADSKADVNLAVKDLEEKVCSPVSVDYAGQKSKNYFFDLNKCSEYKKIFSSLEKIVSLDGKKLLAWDIQLQNDGKTVAENITLRSAVPVDLKAVDSEGNQLSVEAASSGKVFTLPNLNPRESMRIRLKSSTAQPQDYEEKVSDPKITFSGGLASNRKLVNVSGRYSEIVDFLDDLPTILQIIIIMVSSLLITMIWLMPLALLSDAADKRKRQASTTKSE